MINNLPTKERLEDLQFDIAQNPHTYNRRNHELHNQLHGYNVLTIIEDALNSCGMYERLSLDATPIELMRTIEYALKEGAFKAPSSANLM